MRAPAWAIRAILSLVLGTLPLYGWAACKLSSLELPVTMVGSRAVTKLGINGTDVPLTVDSGAFFSFLTRAAAQQLELKLANLPWGMRVQGLTGDVEAKMTTVKKLRLREGQLESVDFIVGGNDESSGAMGLLGRNLLGISDIEYDLANGAVRLMFPQGDCSKTSMAYWAQGKPVSELALLQDDDSAVPPIEALAQLNGKRLHVFFDTGAQSLVSLDMAKRAGVETADMKSIGKLHGIGRGDVNGWTAAIDRFELGDEAISNIRLIVADFELRNVDMLLGIDFFLSHRIYISKKQQRMYFTYNGGTVFAVSAMEAAMAKADSPPAPPSPAGAASAPAPADIEPASDAAAYARRGAASAARLDFQRALADLDRACELAPQVAEYFVRRAAVREAMRENALALKDYETALQLDPQQAEARLRRAWWRAESEDREGTLADLQALDKTLAPQAHQRLQMASLYQMLDLPDRALAQWALWIPAHPQDAALDEVLNNRCWMRTMLNTELDRALDDCDQAIELQPKNGNHVDSRAWLRLRRGEWRKALSDFNRALKLRESAWSLYGRGIVQRRLGDMAASQADLDAARKLLPTIDAQAGRYGLAADAKPSAP